MAIKKNFLVQKRNILNELRAYDMSLQELRFFNIYLSKINKADPNTRVVRFPIDDFKNIMDLGRIDINYMKQVTNKLLSRIVNVPTERGGYNAFQLFKKCTVDMDDQGEWYVQIDAHDDALPLMFEFKNKYFSYQLCNTLRLKSVNQLRMYEILKQYETIGYRILSIEELKELLGISKKEYLQIKDLKKRVIDACQKALKEYTDIKFTYEPHGKKGKGGKIINLKFNIEKNEDYTGQITLESFILEQKSNSDNQDCEQQLSEYDERINFFAEACNNEFTHEEMIVLYDEVHKCMGWAITKDDVKCYDYFHDKYNVLQMQRAKQKINHPFNYMKSIIEKGD